MLFNSYEFLFLFLPIVLLGYFVLFRHRGRVLFLTLASYLFYGWWDFRFCGLMLFSTALDYTAGLIIERSATARRRRAWLAVSVVANLSLLGFFKYFDLAAGTVNQLASALGAAHPLLPLLQVTLPVGISFYTFQSMSYTIDVYHRVVPAQRSFLQFAFYVSFFPQLVAGPIVRYRDLADQLVGRTHSLALAARGAALFVLGLGKKVILADAVAPLAEAVFGLPQPGLADAWLGVLAYTMQIYFDFSAYSDMAVGLGLFFGFRFPQNFNSPYMAVSITDFWRRWHMSLSTWLRDYLYIPLGGNRLGPARTYINLLLTMLLGGLWHGANWTFLIWGGFHGAWLAIERARGGRLWGVGTPVWVQRLTTFLLVMVGWVYFRCASVGQAHDVLGGLVGAHGLASRLPGGLGEWKLALAALPLCLGLAWFAPNTWQLRWSAGLRSIVALLLLFVLCVAVLLVNSSSPFLYFQF
jgi:alginate O-acetyltransferase complex protein AlgI